MESNTVNVIGIMLNSHKVLRGYQSDHVINSRYFEGVAGMRFALKEAATLLHSSIDDQNTQLRLAFQLLRVTEEVCTDPDINTTDFTVGDVVGPAVYLLKLLVRQYGFDCLTQICKKYPWVVPEGLRTPNQVSFYISMVFVHYMVSHSMICYCIYIMLYFKSCMNYFIVQRLYCTPNYSLYNI